MRSEIGARATAGRDCDRARTDRFAAGDVMRCVSDDVDLCGFKFMTVLFLGAAASKRSKLIPIVVIVRERAKFEKVPDAVMLEFQLCTARYVPGQQRENEVRTLFQSV